MFLRDWFFGTAAFTSTGTSLSKDIKECKYTKVYGGINSAAWITNARVSSALCASLIPSGWSAEQKGHLHLSICIRRFNFWPRRCEWIKHASSLIYSRAPPNKWNTHLNIYVCIYALCNAHLLNYPRFAANHRSNKGQRSMEKMVLSVYGRWTPVIHFD
jgi:hypothetical protein